MNAKMNVIQVVKPVLLSLLMLLAGFASADEIKQPHISVYGQAKTEVVPDVMHWSVQVENRGSDLKKVSAEHSTLVADAIKRIRQQDIDKKHIQTSGMSFGEHYEYRDNSRVKTGYVASTTITFKMEDFSKYEALWLSLSQVDAVSVHGVSYDYSKRIEAQNDTRIKALMAAKEKAATMAGAMGLVLGDTLEISEEQQGYDVVTNKARFQGVAMMEMDTGGSAVSPGTINIDMRIKLVVGLNKK